MNTLLALARRIISFLRLKTSRSVKSFGVDVHVGRNCRFWASHAIEIGSHTYIGKEVMVETNASIGSYVLIANRVGLVGRHDHDHTQLGIPVRFSRWVGARQLSARFKNELVVIEDDVWIGYGAILLSGVTVGRGAVVAAGSVVVKSVAPYTIVGGNPAQTLQKRFRDDQIPIHEKMITKGRFECNERRYEAWTVVPGSPDD